MKTNKMSSDRMIKMKNIVLAGIGIMLLLGAGNLLVNKSQISNDKYQTNSTLQITNYPTTTPYIQLPVPLKGIFIPYWSTSFPENDMKYTSYYYFGITPTANGEIENEVGLSNIPIMENIPQKQKKIVLRMLNSTVTEALLTDIAAQKTLINKTNTILVQNSFSGIVLDIEVPFTLQAQKKVQITKFVQQICTAIKANYKTCDILIYGDFSYRHRPYDLKALAKQVDTVLLMAYDFHKSGGEPGPNYSFEEKHKYGYDFKQMVTEATALVPKEKIEVVFGMFGYDWTLNEQGKPLKSATALSLHEIQALNSDSKKIYSNAAKEKSIHYVDTSGQSHIVWYEDEESAAVKTTYLREQGVSRVSFWAQSYF